MPDLPEQTLHDFSPEGILSAAKNFEFRPEQQTMAVSVAEALRDEAALLVEAGMGCAVCLDGALSIHADPELCFRRILPEHITRSVILWKKNHLFSQAASLFVQTIQEY